jgi:hypothetical protein
MRLFSAEHVIYCELSGNLDDWYEKFKHYKSYPVMGRVSFPPNDLKMKREELKNYTGRSIVSIAST